MASFSHRTPQLADLDHYPNPAHLANRSVFELAKTLSSTVTLFGVPGGRSINKYLMGDIPPHFEFRKLRPGGQHAVIVINGFLTQGGQDVSDWTGALQQEFSKATWFHLDWEASRLPLPQWAGNFSLGNLVDQVLGGGRPDLLTAWHSTMIAAERAGQLLADAIVRTPHRRYTLVGHSLGARVIHYALKALAHDSSAQVDSAYLLGGAVGGSAKDDACWRKASTAVREQIVNFYSRHDNVLRWLYQGANALLSRPIGLDKIHLEHQRIVSFDAGRWVQSHDAWKGEFGFLLQKLRATASSSN